MSWVPSTIHKERPCVRVVSSSERSDTEFKLSVGDANVLVCLSVRLNSQEHERREAKKIHAPRNEYLLSVLLALPLGELSPVKTSHRSALPALLNQRLLSIVEDPDGDLWGQSEIASPLEIHGIEVSAKSPKRALSIAHQWAGFGQRTITSRANPDSHALLLSEASMYGIGARVESSGEWLLQPAPYSPKNWTIARWKLAEKLYAELQTASVLTRQ